MDRVYHQRTLLTEPTGLALVQPEVLGLILQLVEGHGGHADDHAGAKDSAVAQKDHYLLAQHGRMTLAQWQQALPAFALFAALCVTADVVLIVVGVVVVRDDDVGAAGGRLGGVEQL